MVNYFPTLLIGMYVFVAVFDEKWLELMILSIQDDLSSISLIS